MKRIFLILFCINLFAQQTKLPMNISEVISLENPTYTVPAGHILQTLPLGTEEDPFDGTTQPGTVGVNDGVSGGWWSLEKIILTEGHKISSSISAGALLYDLGSLKANVKAFKVLWYDESYTIPENTVAEIYSVYSAGINGNPDESTFRKANETEDKALIEGMVLSEGTSIKSWGVISIIEYYENYSNNEIGVLSFVPEAGNVGVRLSSANAGNHGDIGNNALDLSYSNNDTSFGATGDSSVALGENTTASGGVSTAMGRETTASDRSSLVIGEYNLLGSTVTNSATDFSTENTAFVIGNGTANDSRSDALTVLFDGTTNVAGSVTATEFIGDGSQLTNLPASTVNYSDLDDKPFSFGTDENNPGIQATSTTASGSKAFAVGSGTQASGSKAFASGDRTKATNSYTTAMGYKSEASNFASTALGKETIASGQYATAMGQQTTASQNASTAMGDGSFASGNAATAMGSFTEAIGIASTAMGQQTKASGLRATAMGLLTEASGVQSTATGFNTIANANQSTAMGVATTAEDFASVSIGQFNKTDETPNPSAFSLQNTAFVIGNGEDTNSRSNALEVLFDGTTTIAGDLNINSDARLKANIISLGATLSKLLQIDGKTYTMKKDTKNKPKIGLLAQEIETVFPELVSETNNIKSVNYQGLVPVLINALKEQDVLIKEQQRILSEQQSEVDELKSMMQKIIEKL
tara:strand:+ start:902 stop:3001 length:2100 start_codon:yes stop_codon:yes gene_type:complete